TDIDEEEVAERYVGGARRLRLGERLPHAVLVDLVRAWVRQKDRDQRQARRSRLGFDQSPAHGVHRHPVERLIERRQEPDDFEVGLLAEDMERPGAILAGTPGEEDFRSGAGHHRLRYDATNPWRSVSPESKNRSRLIPLRLRV